MGWHMASHLPKLGHPVWVWNRTEQKALDHAQSFGTLAIGIEQVVQADFIFSCLPTSQDMEVLIAAHPPKQGAIWIDCTSGVPESAQNWHNNWSSREVIIWMLQYQVKLLVQKRYVNRHGGR